MMKRYRLNNTGFSFIEDKEGTWVNFKDAEEKIKDLEEDLEDGALEYNELVKELDDIKRTLKRIYTSNWG